MNQTNKNLKELIQDIKAEIPGMLEKYFDVYDPYLFGNKKDYKKQLARKHGLENCIIDEKETFKQRQDSLVGLVDRYNDLADEMYWFPLSIFSKEIFPYINEFRIRNKIIMHPQGHDLNPTSINRLINFYEATIRVLEIIKERLSGY